MKFGLLVWRIKNVYWSFADCIIRNEIKKASQGKVLSGIFRGMKYHIDSVGSLLYPRILGTYERELFDAFVQINKNNYRLMIDVGAAEGYYAIGMAKLNKQLHVVAFEAQENGKNIIGQMAKKNDVSNRIEIQGFCSHKELNEQLSDKNDVFILVDIEGGEEDLLMPEKVPGLKYATLLVEVHDCFSETVGDVLKSRFNATHRIEEIWETKRSVSDFPVDIKNWKKRIFKKAILRSLNEYRGKRMRWFFMIPENKNIRK